MSLMDYNPDLKGLKKRAAQDAVLLKDAWELRQEARKLVDEENYGEAVAHITQALRTMREAEDYSDREFRAALIVLLFDLAEIHYELKDFKQSKKELELIFKLLEPLIKEDAGRFGPMHVNAMELSTRILRSRRKMLDLLAKQQLHTGMLYEKVNSGVAAATDKLVESLRKVAEMLASTGDYNNAIKFYMEAIKISRKRSGKVTRRDVAMTIEMAKIMMKNRRQSERARRLLNAVLPHAVSLDLVEMEQEIIQLIANIDENLHHEPMWRTMMDKLSRRKRDEARGTSEEEESEEERGTKQVVEL